MVDSSDEDSDDEMALLVRRFKSFLKRMAIRRKAMTKAKQESHRELAMNVVKKDISLWNVQRRRIKKKERKTNITRKARSTKSIEEVKLTLAKNGILMTHLLHQLPHKHLHGNNHHRRM